MSLLVILMLLLDIHITLAFLYLASPTFQLWVFLNVHFIVLQVSCLYLVKLFWEVFWHLTSSSCVSFQHTISTKISFQTAQDQSSGMMQACMPYQIKFPSSPLSEVVNLWNRCIRPTCQQVIYQVPSLLTVKGTLHRDQNYRGHFSGGSCIPSSQSKE